MESPTNHNVAPAVTSPRLRDDNNNMAYARQCVVMEIIKAETDYVTHLHDVIQVPMAAHFYIKILQKINNSQFI